MGWILALMFFGHMIYEIGIIKTFGVIVMLIALLFGLMRCTFPDHPAFNKDKKPATEMNGE